MVTDEAKAELIENVKNVIEDALVPVLVEMDILDGLGFATGIRVEIYTNGIVLRVDASLLAGDVVVEQLPWRDTPRRDR